MTAAFAISGITDPYVFRQASLCASRLVRKCQFAVDAWEDLRQEMFLDLLQRLPRFRPEKGDWHGFVRGVMRHRSSVLAADERRRLLRFPDATGGNGSDDEEGDFDSAPEVPGEDGSAVEFRLDVQRVIAKLPPHLREVALLLRDNGVAEISRLTGKSRSAIHLYMRQIREAFEEAGVTPERFAFTGPTPLDSLSITISVDLTKATVGRVATYYR